ncbi:MAG: hypothetical protein PVI30_17880 [Myxococcales bacterium]
MKPSVGLVIAGVLFVAFLLGKLLLPRSGQQDGSELKAARKRVADARRRARDRKLPKPERAAALREAAEVALEGLGRPGLAASYARRAERLDPSAPESLGLLAASLRRVSRYRALERFLWRHVAAGQVGSPSVERAFDELLSLYEGPMRRPEMAEGLRRLRSRSAA